MTTEAALDIANRAKEIATLPEVTIRIIDVVQDSRSTAHDLHQIVGNDPALSARVLRVVNSAFYGLPGQIGSIDRAIMMLGLNAVKNIAIAASLSRMFKSNVVHDDFSGKDLWTHSVAVGAANKLLASMMGLTLPDEAFLAGLLHDLGLVAILQSCQDELLEILTLVRAGVPYIKAEVQVIGATHEEVGAALAQRWRFPRSLQYVTGYHHRPEELAQENRLLVTVTHVSDVLCAERGLGMSITASGEKLASRQVDELGLTSEQIEGAFTQLEDELETVRSLIE